MDSVRSFVALWAIFTAVILGYAVVDLRTHPELREEDSFTLEPDLSKIGSLPHWGGRLLKEGAHGLLFCNAVAIAGILSLSSGAVVARVKRKRSPAQPNSTGSLPPPRLSSPPPV